MHNRARRRPNQTLLDKRETSPCGQTPPKVEKFINVEKKKIQLIQKLNEIIQSFAVAKHSGMCTEDPLIIGLQKIEEEAKLHDFKEIVKMANLAIGKRILNLELDRKRAEIQNKIEKKRQIQEYFRQNRIKKTQYQQIALKKLKNHTFIVKPYADGKAFVESTLFYNKIISCVTGESYEDYFEQCSYLETIKHINKIFFNNFSNSSSEQSRKQAINNPLLRLGFVLVLILISLCVCTSLTRNAIVSYVFFVGNLVLLIFMGSLAVYSYLSHRTSKNQLEQTAMEVMEYFKTINARNRKLGMRHQWICPSHFLYLEVKFDDFD